ncbi:ankyrin repeat-containing domain protein [Cadophora sp. MPI-SDFR-AT-0126]|nr:ankyrin repeat-containing domain protein [Leotiomycetes sp. MPI-SDFR-AT-0126]
MADPFSIFVGAVGLAGLGGKAVEAVHEFYGDYSRAITRISHAKAQKELLLSYLHHIPVSQADETLDTLRSSFQAIAESFPEGLDCETKKGKFKWATRQKAKVSETLGQLKEVEISATRLSTLQILEGTESIRKILLELSARQRDTAIEENRRQVALSGKRGQLYSNNPSHPQEAKIYRGDCWGISICLISSSMNETKRYALIIRVKSFYSSILHSRITMNWPSWLDLSVSPTTKIQRLIHDDDPILEACRNDDSAELGRLFMAGKAHPNDTTTDNLTLLYVAITKGNENATQVLLDNGADPNLTYGSWDTSPLCTAFFCGHIEIVRLLLSAGAELDYVNRRTWTCLRYLYDPDRCNLYTVELLELCHREKFDGWDCPDTSGWTLAHRAAAFGHERDIRKLQNLKVCFTTSTLALHWLPIFCAVRYANESTFNFLAAMIPPSDLSKLRDVRGWTLLHLAAMTGSEAILARLFRCQCDPYTVSDKSEMSVPGGLEFRELTPGDIAKACGHEELYNGLLTHGGWKTEHAKDPT